MSIETWIKNYNNITGILRCIFCNDSNYPQIDYARLASSTDGFSGSDLHELCRQAAVYRVRDLAREELQREQV